MVGIGSSHIQGITILDVLSIHIIVKIARIIQSLIHPTGVIGIEVGCEYAATIAVTNFERHDFFVLGIFVAGMRVLRINERGIEHWSTGDETSIDEHVILFIKIVVNTTLYVSTQIVLGIGFSLVLAIVHTIVTPITGVGKTTGNECAELVAIVLKLCECALGHYKTIVVAVIYITHTQLLVLEIGVSSCRIILGQNFTTIFSIDKIVAAEKVYNDILMQTFIIA